MRILGRKGKRWEREAIIQIQDKGNPESHLERVGIRISGSGTRSLPKRSFKLFARDRYGSDSFADLLGHSVDEVVLRGDGSPNSFLKNVFIEQVAREYATHLDVQESATLDLYVNAEYWGAYRSMPAKDPAWLLDKHGINGCDMLAGPAHRIVSGSDNGWDEVLGLLSSSSLNTEQLSRLETLVEVESLIQIAAFDLYTGRADCELNTRVWRPHSADGKWRWILYDMDLWTSGNDPSLGRMLAEPAAAAPYMKVIWSTPSLQERLLSYLVALLNGPLEPNSAAARMDDLYGPERSYLIRDYQRWSSEMSCVHPDSGVAILNETVSNRPGYLLSYLASQSGHEEIRVPVQHTRGGRILLDGIPISSKEEVYGWQGIVVLLEAVPDKGMRFSHWKGIDNPSALLLAELDKLPKIEAVFVREPAIRP